jgi:hypothetical protein
MAGDRLRDTARFSAISTARESFSYSPQRLPLTAFVVNGRVVSS